MYVLFQPKIFKNDDRQTKGLLFSTYTYFEAKNNFWFDDVSFLKILA